MPKNSGKRTLVVGTGYLGQCVVEKANLLNLNITSTYNVNQKFRDSVPFNFLKDDISDKINLSTIENVILALNIKNEVSFEGLKYALSVFLKQIKDNRLIYISSDAVFNGLDGMYSEDDTPKPATDYGKIKMMFEDYIKSTIKNYCIIRPSYIYGYSLGNLDRRLQQTIGLIKNNARTETFGDMYKSPIDVNQLSELIIKEVLSDYVGIIHAGGERMSVFDFKKQALETLGLPTDNLIEVKIPLNPSVEMLRDTSLDNSLMKKLTGIKPYTIQEALQKHKPQYDS